MKDSASINPVQAMRKFMQQPQFWRIGIIFALASILFAFWITRLPYVQDKLGISEGQIGLALFFMPIGSILSLFVSNWMINRLGEGKTTVIAIFCHIGALLLPIIAPSYPALCLALFTTGLTGGTLNVSVNATVTSLEKIHKTEIMATCHGFFSLGGMVGGGLSSLMIGLEVDPIQQMLLTVIICWLLIVLVIGKPLLSIVSGEKYVSKGFSLPPGPVIGLALIGLCTMLGEGVIMDWSTIYLKDVVKTTGYITGLGFAVYSFCMALGRFYGDSIIPKLGALNIIRFGSILGLAGVIGVLTADTWLTIGGFALLGIGYSCMVPVLFSRSANVEGVKPAIGISSVASAGYIGFLIGPVSIGLIAESYGLTASFSLLLVLLLFSLFYAPRVIRS
ncbi:MAG: MFS transporter [Bacteroidota bacterium]